VANAPSSHKKRLCIAIKRHLASHPFAADTAEGIVASWLPPQGFEQAAEHIAAALEELVAEQWLGPNVLPDGNILYTANLEKCSTLPPTS
jgi:hypothetical protein